MPLIGIVEIVDDLGQPTPAGAVGHVAVTGISKLGMPLIRYLLGDNSTSTSYADCSCGLGWPTIGSVEGRSEDVVITRDGRRIGLLATSVIKHAETGILESQLIQRAYDRFDCKLVIETGKLADRSAIEQGIKDELRIRMGYDVLVSFEYLSQIPRTSRDKFRAMLVNFDGGVQ